MSRRDDDEWADAPSAEWPSVARVLKQAAMLAPDMRPGKCNEDMLALAVSVAAGAELYGGVAHLAPLAEELSRQVMLFEPFERGNDLGAVCAVRAFLSVNGKKYAGDDATLCAALAGPEGTLASAVQSGLASLTVSLS